MKSETPDLRSPLAKARDEWLKSVECQECLHVGILRSPQQFPYLKHRLETAFVAGANWATNELATEIQTINPDAII